MIYVKTLTGKTIEMDLRFNVLVDELKREIEKREGIPTDQQRIIFGGTQLENEKTLSHYKIDDGDVLNLVLRLRGMISNFSEYDENDPLTAYLMNEDIKELPASLLKKKRRELESSWASGLKLEYTDSKILTECGRKKLIGVANYIHAMQQISGKSEALLQDIKIVFPQGCVDNITGTQVEADLRKYHLAEKPSDLKFVLRRTSPTTGCIPWHVDGAYSTCVVQYTLNDDSSYRGGRLCYYTEDAGFFCPPRPAGAVIVHKKEMHAVSKLISGTRYILFVVDQMNGLGGETANIVTLTEEKVDQIIAQ